MKRKRRKVKDTETFKEETETSLYDINAKVMLTREGRF